MQKTKPVLKYPGAKQGISDWIISHFPPHRVYVEPYLGSAAVLLNKGHVPIETVNDINDDVVNLFRTIRQQPEALAKAVYSTPYARAEYNAAFATGAETDIERARIFLIKSWQSHGHRQLHYNVGWKRDISREAAYAARYWADLPGRICDTAERLRGVQIESIDALELIKAYNAKDVLIYADPPYLLSTRSQKKHYRHEMTDADHAELLQVLRQHKGFVVLSGYDNDLYNSCLQDWHTDTIPTRASNAQPRIEKIWMNFEYQLQF
ncbi:MAG: DNA adenine methylase [Oscillospiraceae bacterium]